MSVGAGVPVAGGSGSIVEVAVCVAAGPGTEMVFVGSKDGTAGSGAAGLLRASLRSQANRLHAEKPKAVSRKNERRVRPGLITRGYENE